MLVADVKDVRFAVISRGAGDLDGLDLDLDDGPRSSFHRREEHAALAVARALEDR